MCLRRRRLPWPLEPRESTEPVPEWEPREKMRAKKGCFFAGLLPLPAEEEGEEGERGVRGGLGCAGGWRVYTDAELGT